MYFQQRLKLKHDNPLSNVAFRCKVRHYSAVGVSAGRQIIRQGQDPTFIGLMAGPFTR